jgi:hypothetical protein
MSAVAPRTTMVVGAAVVVCVSFYCARGLKDGEIREHQQNQQSPAQPAPVHSTQDGLVASTHITD